MVTRHSKTINLGSKLYRSFVLSKNHSRQVRDSIHSSTNSIGGMFRLLAERLLTFYLIPWDGNIDDKVRVILTLYSNVDENAQR